MVSVIHVPSAPLNLYINYFYYRDEPMPYQRERILPLPSLNLKINFGGALQARMMESTYSYSCAESWSVGICSRYHEVEWSNDMHLMMVDFKPGCAYPFLRLPLAELHDQVVSLEVLWGTFAAEIRERLYAAPTVQDRFALLERLLLERLTDVPHGLTIVQAAIAEIARHQGMLSIRGLSDQLGISQKHLIAQFNRFVGESPKSLARLYRFWHVLRSIDPTQPADWTQIAHQTCYYDQSHFNKDFESFTGHTPSDYLRLRRQIERENPQHAKTLLQLPIG